MAINSIVLADDESIQRDTLSTIIQRYVSADIRLCSNGRDALSLIEEELPDLLITDIRMPVMDGMELIKEVSSRYPSLKTVLISAYSEFSYAKTAITCGVSEYLLKPFRPEEIRKLLEKLDAEIESILSTGVEVHTEVTVGKDISFEQLHEDYDCLYVAIGAHTDKKTGIPGEDSKHVMSAVEMLRSIGDDVMPDFTGKRVVVIGGGNVAMDVTRSSIRLGAEKVTCVYRRRVEDMTALPDEITGAMAEGAELLTLMAPVRIEADEDGNAAALWVQPQLIGEADKSGRPRPNKADLPEQRIPADIIVVAIGQGIEIQGFEQAGVPIKRGTFVAGLSGQVGDMDNLFAGGDCVTGPATAIRAIAAGKVAAANIDVHLGFQHEITVDVDIPGPKLNNRAPHGRINTTEREACERRCDFEDIECGLTEEGARTEASRCLRCDHYGYGIFRGGRNVKW